MIFYRQGNVSWGTEGRLFFSLLVQSWFYVSDLERVEDCAWIRVCGLVLSLSHSRHYIRLVGVRDCKVQILVYDKANVVFCFFVTTVCLSDNIGVCLLNCRQRSVCSSTRWFRVNMVHPWIYSIELVELCLLHHFREDTLG